MAKKKGFKKWLKVNKEGAIVGGVLGGILIINQWYIGNPYLAIVFVGIHSFFYQTLGFLGVKVADFIGIISPVILGIIIGAFIDSKWRPEK